MIRGWELNRNAPTPKFAKAIIAFLGYFPFSGDGSFGKQLYYTRLITGKTQAAVAEMIGSDASIVRLVELNKRERQDNTWEKIQEYIRVTFGLAEPNLCHHP